MVSEAYLGLVWPLTSPRVLLLQPAALFCAALVIADKVRWHSSSRVAGKAIPQRRIGIVVIPHWRLAVVRVLVALVSVIVWRRLAGVAIDIVDGPPKVVQHVDLANLLRAVWVAKLGW